MRPTELQAWQTFEQTGKIDAYLSYLQIHRFPGTEAEGMPDAEQNKGPRAETAQTE